MNLPAMNLPARGMVSRACLLLLGATILATGSLPSLAQSDPNAPGAVAERFLSGIASRDPVERERLLTDVQWQTASIDYPPLEGEAVVDERFFATDSARVRGYERLVLVTIPVNSGARFTRTYRLVAYADRMSRKWKIWSFEEGSDMEAVVAFWGERAGPTNSREAISATVRYAECLASSGHLHDALSVYRSVIEATSDAPDADSVAASATDALHSLERIIGTTH